MISIAVFLLCISLRVVYVSIYFLGRPWRLPILRTLLLVPFIILSLLIPVINVVVFFLVLVILLAVGLFFIVFVFLQYVAGANGLFGSYGVFSNW